MYSAVQCRYGVSPSLASCGKQRTRCSGRQQGAVVGIVPLDVRKSAPMNPLKIVFLNGASKGYSYGDHKERCGYIRRGIAEKKEVEVKIHGTDGRDSD